ncbi:hypothetical protein BO82DRAFT_422734 [Aspergillus uvarum CBS 121591]|uniref:Uncharacterized protein n=1 Tax=Aspergillus uvarum CBS 121591 TaxID=1448315 RepID=A0A319BWI4_9EURO|nr:hypothetical protein BO82DRAFT_422734 [Aspergillus uvarum CBS 121591]PYH78046.1 hypothetical protein BO82DRAFT_422734 [Aspergillus uvarum CBS 121591]
MSQLASYLNQPYQTLPLKYLPDQGAVSSTRSDNEFLDSYTLAHVERPDPRVYHDVSDFRSAGEDKQAELVFLTGYPSPQWLNAVVTRYGIDHRFLHRHLDFLPTGQRDWYAVPSIPSRSQKFIQHVMPCIVFAGHEGRFVSADDLQQARFACAELLRQRSKSYFERTGTPVGQMIVCGVNIHSGEAMVLEHAIIVSSDYGHTLEWSTVQQVPFLALKELFIFHSAAAMQYLNMLRKDIMQATHRTQIKDVASLNMEDISNFEYTKTVLVRWAAHFRALGQALDLDCSESPLGAPRTHQIFPLRGRMLTLKRRDLNFLVAEARVLIELCDSGKATIMGNFLYRGIQARGGGIAAGRGADEADQPADLHLSSDFLCDLGVRVELQAVWTRAPGYLDLSGRHGALAGGVCDSR